MEQKAIKSNFVPRVNQVNQLEKNSFSYQIFE